MTIFTNLAWEDSLELFICYRGHLPETKTETKPCIAICLRLTPFLALHGSIGASIYYTKI